MLSKAISLPGLPIGKGKSSSGAPAVSSGDQAATDIYTFACSLAKKMGCTDLEISRASIATVIVLANESGRDPAEVLNDVLVKLRETEK